MICNELAKRGEDYLRDAVNIAISINDRNLKNSALAVIVKTLASERLYNKAKELLGMIDDEELKLQSMRDIALILLKNKKLAEGIDLIREIGIEEFRTLAISEAIKGLLELDMYDEAIQLLELMSEESIYRDEALKSIAIYHMKKREIERAVDVINKIKNPILRAVAKSWLPIYEPKLGDKLIREAVSEIENVKDKLFFGAEDKSFLRDFGLTSQKILELQNVAFLAKRANMSELAEEIQKKIVSMLEDIQELDERYDLMSWLIRRATEYDELMDISLIIKKVAEQINTIDNPLVRAQLLKEIAIYHIRSGDIDRAKRLIAIILKQLEGVKEVYQRDALLKDLGVSILKIGELDILESVINGIDEPRFKLELLVLYALNSNKEKARKLVEQAEKIVDEIIDETWLLHALIRMMEAYLYLDENQRVIELLDKMNSVFKRVENKYTKSTLLALAGAKLISKCSE